MWHDNIIEITSTTKFCPPLSHAFFLPPLCTPILFQKWPPIGRRSTGNEAHKEPGRFCSRNPMTRHSRGRKREREKESFCRAQNEEYANGPRVVEPSHVVKGRPGPFSTASRRKPCSNIFSFFILGDGAPNASTPFDPLH